MNGNPPKYISNKFLFKDRSININRIKDLDSLVDQVSDDEFNFDERLPYWAELWPSSIGLSRFIFSNEEIFQNKTILELGCGLGLTSICLSLQNPLSLLLTDYEQEALNITAHNFRLNNLNPPKMQLLDWRKPDLNQQFDRIVASDIVYEERFFNPVINVFRRFLAYGGLIVLAEPNRSVARGFFKQLRESGYKLSRTSQPVDQDGKTIEVSVYKIMR